MGTIWIFKTNYANPTYQVEYSRAPGVLAERLRFRDIHDLRDFLDHHRLPDVTSGEVLRELSISGHIEIRTTA